MIKHAWSLVFFTVLGQMGAGLYLVHNLVSYYSRFFNSGIQLNSRRLLFISFALSALALVISFTHLGNPRNAIFALSNFKYSWLSREIFFLAAFIGILLLEIMFANWVTKSHTIELIYSFIGVLVSVAFIFSMIRLYQLETVPAWNSSYTFLNFYNSALLGGVLILLLSTTFKPWNGLVYILLVLLLTQLVLFYPSLSSDSKITYLPIVFYGLAFLISLSYRTSFIPDQSKSWINLIMVLFFSLGIIIERYIFYASYKNVGV
jgi:anaerobic dimethyl sulfoxide reductase subunit C (anchor subunit)